MFRRDFTAFVEVVNGNPNGDPDRGNKPRIDPYTGTGFMSDGSIKRRIRTYASEVLNHQIFVKERSVLSETKRQVAEETKIKASGSENPQLQVALLDRYIDLRWFGGILSMGKEGDSDKKLNAGQVTGPITIQLAPSVEPIQMLNLSLTRCCLQNQEDTEQGKMLKKAALEAGDEIDATKSASGQMGNKHFLPYAVYRISGTINPQRAAKSRLTEKDVADFFTALEFGFEHDVSAARPSMATRELIIWEHESLLGNAKLYEVMETVEIRRTSEGPARKWSDYVVTVSNPRSGVKMTRRMSTDKK